MASNFVDRVVNSGREWWRNNIVAPDPNDSPRTSNLPVVKQDTLSAFNTEEGYVVRRNDQEAWRLNNDGGVSLSTGVDGPWLEVSDMANVPAGVSDMISYGLEQRNRVGAASIERASKPIDALTATDIMKREYRATVGVDDESGKWYAGAGYSGKVNYTEAEFETHTEASSVAQSQLELIKSQDMLALANYKNNLMADWDAVHQSNKAAAESGPHAWRAPGIVREVEDFLQSRGFSADGVRLESGREAAVNDFAQALIDNHSLADDDTTFQRAKEIAYEVDASLGLQNRPSSEVEALAISYLDTRGDLVASDPDKRVTTGDVVTAMLEEINDKQGEEAMPRQQFLKANGVPTVPGAENLEERSSQVAQVADVQELKIAADQVEVDDEPAEETSAKPVLAPPPPEKSNFQKIIDFFRREAPRDHYPLLSRPSPELLATIRSDAQANSAQPLTKEKMLNVAEQLQSAGYVGMYEMMGRPGIDSGIEAERILRSGNLSRFDRLILKFRGVDEFRYSQQKIEASYNKLVDKKADAIVRERTAAMKTLRGVDVNATIKREDWHMLPSKQYRAFEKMIKTNNALVELRSLTKNEVQSALNLREITKPELESASRSQTTNPSLSLKASDVLNASVRANQNDIERFEAARLKAIEAVEEFKKAVPLAGYKTDPGRGIGKKLMDQLHTPGTTTIRLSTKYQGTAAEARESHAKGLAENEALIKTIRNAGMSVDTGRAVGVVAEVQKKSELIGNSEREDTEEDQRMKVN